jgi:uncharacterized membrane protein YesL
MTFDKLNKMNAFMIGYLKIALLNLLWVVSVVATLGLCFGPATYAMQTYYDHWLRRKEDPPVIKSFWRFFKANFKQSLLVGWGYLLLFGIIITNLFVQTFWLIQVGNILMFIVVLLSFTHSFTLMSAIGYRKIIDLFKASTILGVSYLHFTILAWASILIFYLFFSSVLPAVLFIFGIGFAGFALSTASRLVLTELKKITTKEN